MFVAGQPAGLLNTRQTSQGMVLESLSLDALALSDLQIRYVFSTYELRRPDRSGLRYEGMFEDPEAAWRVYLYRVTACGSSARRCG